MGQFQGRTEDLARGEGVLQWRRSVDVGEYRRTWDNGGEDGNEGTATPCGLRKGCWEGTASTGRLEGQCT
jgi:hypothetical protein